MSSPRIVYDQKILAKTTAWIETSKAPSPYSVEQLPNPTHNRNNLVNIDLLTGAPFIYMHEGPLARFIQHDQAEEQSPLKEDKVELSPKVVQKSSD